MVETLLVGNDSGGNRVDPNSVLREGKRPLGLAASNGLYDVTSTLLSHAQGERSHDSHAVGFGGGCVGCSTAALGC